VTNIYICLDNIAPVARAAAINERGVEFNGAGDKRDLSLEGTSGEKRGLSLSGTSGEKRGLSLSGASGEKRNAYAQLRKGEPVCC
jgi:hypothetical protein